MRALAGAGFLQESPNPLLVGPEFGVWGCPCPLQMLWGFRAPGQVCRCEEEEDGPAPDRQEGESWPRAIQGFAAAVRASCSLLPEQVPLQEFSLLSPPTIILIP